MAILGPLLIQTTLHFAYARLNWMDLLRKRKRGAIVSVDPKLFTSAINLLFATDRPYSLARPPAPPAPLKP